MHEPRSINDKRWGDPKEIKAWKKQDKALQKDLKRFLKEDRRRNFDFAFVLIYLEKKLRCIRSHFLGPECILEDKSFVKDVDEALAFLERYLKDEYEGPAGKEGSEDLHAFFGILADRIEEWWD